MHSQKSPFIVLVGIIFTGATSALYTGDYSSPYGGQPSIEELKSISETLLKEAKKAEKIIKSATENNIRLDMEEHMATYTGLVTRLIHALRALKYYTKDDVAKLDTNIIKSGNKLIEAIEELMPQFEDGTLANKMDRVIGLFNDNTVSKKIKFDLTIAPDKTASKIMFDEIVTDLKKAKIAFDAIPDRYAQFFIKQQEKFEQEELKKMAAQQPKQSTWSKFKEKVSKAFSSK